MILNSAIHDKKGEQFVLRKPESFYQVFYIEFFYERFTIFCYNRNGLSAVNSIVYYCEIDPK